MSEPTVKTLELKAIKPYWRNPRDNRAAVEKVKQSIQHYGYNQLIAVDKKYVIIAGHTRFLALQALGWKKAPVMVLDLDEKKAKAYRIIDNKTNEFATWTDDLFIELRELGDLPLMQPFFEENLEIMIANSVGQEGLAGVTATDIENTQNQMGQRFGHGSDVYANSEKEIACPECGHRFFITK
jgi:hypothetical protein